MPNGIEFVGEGVTNRFWNQLLDLYKLKHKFKGAIYQYAGEVGFSMKDGFFYETVLPVLIENRIFKEIENEYSNSGDRGRLGKVYEFNRDNLSKFIIKNNPRYGRLFEIWIKQLDHDMGWETYEE